MKLLAKLVTAAVAVPLALVLGLVMALIMAVILVLIGVSVLTMILLGIPTALADAALASIFGWPAWVERNERSKAPCPCGCIVNDVPEPVPEKTPMANRDADESSSGDCDTCRKRAEEYDEMRSDRSVKVASLGRANCQECGERYTVLAEKFEDA